jgi:all-trans-nonaprenyl-diphosphate synthase
MFEYGMNLGLAFQIVDDILDFTQTSEQLGKPAGSDLSKGNLTAPVLFALQREPELRELIDSEFMEEGSLDAAISLVHRSGGIDRARELAKQKGDLARQALDSLPQGPLRQSLDRMVDYVLERVY